jgi:hypothetical protein
MRTIIEVPQQQLDALDLICRTEGISRAEAIRRAITRMVGETRHALVTPAFAVWRDRPVDRLGYERRLRDEWETAPRKNPRVRRAKMKQRQPS